MLSRFPTTRCSRGRPEGRPSRLTGFDSGTYRRVPESRVILEEPSAARRSPRSRASSASIAKSEGGKLEKGLTSLPPLRRTAQVRLCMSQVGGDGCQLDPSAGSSTFRRLAERSCTLARARAIPTVLKALAPQMNAVCLCSTPRPRHGRFRRVYGHWPALWLQGQYRTNDTPMRRPMRASHVGVQVEGAAA